MSAEETINSKGNKILKITSDHKSPQEFVDYLASFDTRYLDAGRAKAFVMEAQRIKLNQKLKAND